MFIDPSAEFHVTAAERAHLPQERRAQKAARRHPVDLLVRYAWKGLRATVMLKDVTRFGAKIEGIEALRKGDGLTLLLPGLPASDATVAWAMGRAAGLVFERPLDAADLIALVRDFAPSDQVRFTPERLLQEQKFVPEARAA